MLSTRVIGDQLGLNDTPKRVIPLETVLAAFKKFNQEKKIHLSDSIPSPDQKELKGEEEKIHLSLENISAHFTAICQFENSLQFISNKQKLSIEKYKLALMQTTLAHLSKNTYQPKNDPVIHYGIGRKALFWSLMGIRMSLEIMGGFLGGIPFMEFFPTIPDPIFYGVAVIFAGVNGILTWSYESDSLKSALGVTTLDKSSKSILQVYDEQMITVKRMNENLLNGPHAAKITSAFYTHYVRSAQSFNVDLLEKKKLFEEKHQERLGNKIVRLAVLGVGAILYGSAAYYITIQAIAFYSFLSFIAPPVGMALAIVAGIVGATAALSYQVPGMSKLFNPQARKLDRLKEKVNDMYSSEKLTGLCKNGELEFSLKERQTRSRINKQFFTMRVERALGKVLAPRPPRFKRVVEAVLASRQNNKTLEAKTAETDSTECVSTTSTSHKL